MTRTTSSGGRLGHRHHPHAGGIGASASGLLACPIVDTVLNVLHVVTAVFLVGPMAVLPHTALRALRLGNGPMVELLARSTWVFSLASLLVAVLGFGIVGMADEEWGLSLTTGWVLASIVLYGIAFLLSVLLVVPALRQAGAALADGTPDGEAGSYARIAASSGVVTLLLVAVTVLMVWKP